LHLKETEKIYKHELNQLPFIGSTFCLEGTLPQSSDVEGIEKLEISLMHESNDESERCMLFYIQKIQPNNAYYRDKTVL